MSKIRVSFTLLTSLLAPSLPHSLYLSPLFALTLDLLSCSQSVRYSGATLIAGNSLLCAAFAQSFFATSAHSEQSVKLLLIS